MRGRAVGDVVAGVDVDGYRARVREFIATRSPRHDSVEGLRAPTDAADEVVLRSWYAALYDQNYLGSDWPVEHGGDPEHHPLKELIVMEELIRGGAPRPIDQVLLASHALVTFGTDAQQAHYLPRIRSGEDIWCQLFSEPGAGSDLAGLSTRATRVENGWQIDGQKVWSTDAHWAQRGLLLARTDPEAVAYAGITAFVVDMDTPGIVVREIRENTGAAEFCEVFFDGAVIPVDAVVGEVNAGWTVATSGLASERTHVGANAVVLELLHADLVALAREIVFPDGRRAIEHEQIQHALATWWAEVTAVQLLVRTTAAEAVAGGGHASDGPACKLAYSELNVALCTWALGLGMSGEVTTARGRDLVHKWQHLMLWSRALTISGGASEIMAGLLARQLLGFPRSWSTHSRKAG